MIGSNVSRRQILKITGSGTVSISQSGLIRERSEKSDQSEIEDWYDLNAVRNNLSGEYILNNDLDAATSGYSELVANPENGWEPIGTSGAFNDLTDAFRGRFDGNGNSISDLSISRPDENFVGLFGGIDTATITNLQLNSVSIEGSNRVGGIAGANSSLSDSEGGRLTGISVSGDILGEGRVGGIIGQLNSHRIEQSEVDVKITGEDSAGAIAGKTQGGNIVDSTAQGTVTGSQNQSYAIGALVGRHNFGKLINSHYNIENLSVYGEKIVDAGALFPSQYQRWVNNNRKLSLSESELLTESDDGYVEISDVEQLREALGFFGKEEFSWRLTSNIDLTDSDPDLFIPYLLGELDGNDHTIILDISGHIGRTGAVGHNVGGIVKNLNIEGRIRGRLPDNGRSRFVGALVGKNSGSVKGCTASAEVIGSTGVGGLVGGNARGVTITSSDGQISNSYANGTVDGDFSIGGLVGRNYETTSVVRSTAETEVNGRETIGGLVGENGGEIRSSAAKGQVVGEQMYTNAAAGGLVGENIEDGVITTSFVTGSVRGQAVEGEPITGGLIGRTLPGSEATDVYWDIETAGQSEAIGDEADDASNSITSLVTSKMKGASAETNMESLNFEDTWATIENPPGYPVLQWQTDSNKKSVEDYADDNSGVVTGAGLASAFNDWQSGEIGPSLLAGVFEAWQSGEPVD